MNHKSGGVIGESLRSYLSATRWAINWVNSQSLRSVGIQSLKRLFCTVELTASGGAAFHRAWLSCRGRLPLRRQPTSGRVRSGVHRYRGLSGVCGYRSTWVLDELEAREPGLWRRMNIELDESVGCLLAGVRCLAFTLAKRIRGYPVADVSCALI
jgi:hypothetical protein